MRAFKHHPSRTPGQLTILAIAIASTLVIGQAQALVPDPTQLGTTNSGDVTLLNNSTSVSGGATGFVNTSGTIGTLNNSGTISGNNTGINNQGTITSLNNSTTGSITGTINGTSGGHGINNSGSIGTLSNSGSIDGRTGIYNSGHIGTLGMPDSGIINSGTINGTQTGIYNNGIITSLSNTSTGSIKSSNYYGGTGLYNDGSIGTLSNSGTIGSVGTYYNYSYGRGLYNDGTITTLNNSGTISSTGINNYGTGLYNDGTIGTLSNSGTISSTGTSYGGGKGLYNDGVITSLDNSGTINGGNGGGTGLYNQGSIATLNNSGTISGGNEGIYSDRGSSIGTLDNSGTISGGRTGIYNNRGSSIGTLNNSGTISGGSTGISNQGSMGTLNNSGTISSRSGYAIYNASTATLGTVTNSGTIAGTIRNDSAQDLTINGGSGSTFGRLTGPLFDTSTHSYGAGTDNIGLITNTNSNLIFAAGNQLLNDTIDVGTFAVSNTGSTLQVNNSINITGNYNQGANASLILGVGSNAVTTGNIATDAGYGRLVVSGTANIDSGSSVGLKQLGSYGFAQGQRYVVVQANTTGTNYNASSLHYTAAGYNVAGSSVVDGNNTDLLLTLGSAIPVTPPETTPTSYAPVNQATTSGGVATLAGLFNYGGYNAGLMNLFNAAAALDSPAAANHAAAQLSPTATLSAATQASTASTVQVLNVTTAHVDGLRTAQNGNNGSGVATGESASSTGLWGQGFGGSSRLGERDDVAGYHAHYSGLLLGADAALNDSWRAGGVFSYTKTTVNNDGNNSGSSANVNSYGLFGYASYTGSPWYVDMSLGAIQHQYDTTRDVSFPGFSGTAKGQHDGMQYIASVLAGYPIDLGPKMANTVLTPIAGLTYSTLRQDSYTEKDGGGAALHVSANNVGSLKSDLGAKLERTFGTPYGNVVPSAQLTYRHEYHDNAPQSVSNYAADTSGATSFASTGAKAIADTGVMALGVTLVRSQNLSIGAKYTLEAGSGYAANTGDVQVRWDF
jgi:outer membrane autotransporter protein